MKKIFKCFIAAAAAMIACAAAASAARAEDTVKFTRVQSCGGVTYTCVNTYTAGEIDAYDIRALPNSAVNEGFIYRFAIYYDKIYYLTGAEGSDCVIGSIYRCNLDGSGNELIANDADALATPYLSDGCLYYVVYNDYDNWFGRNLRGGIMKINLNTGSYGRLVTDSDAYIKNVLGDKLFYSTAGSGKYYLMTVNGAYIGINSEYDTEIQSDTIIGGTAYVGGTGAIYSLDWNRDRHWIGSAVQSVNGTPVLGESYVENVTGGYIYYTVGFANPALYYHTAPDIAMYRMPVGGGASELAAMWYVS